MVRRRSVIEEHHVEVVDVVGVEDQFDGHDAAVDDREVEDGLRVAAGSPRQPPRFSTSSAPARLRRIHASWTASSASLADPSIR
jgi:hypothetical protein